ncbi:acetyl-CoA C-acetyltransferase [Burkholderia stagnalis]|uniref:Acetyl-CoA C-acetyltransferase n=1 Tax=Burkholderia stagnalis TaxID=1503054 RepID=A0ABX9YW02_9BURK|nr:acetyl-CoA C-acetyltransferase [Burkholderia stagnalis]RQQ65087.1 acetyl-CoA C-acetyltransferase [Burkholderia stagnalis]RQQ73851.1 acetyl-CoA C-acetyltransferase [Burkholderia stagnalis]RQQ75741.1 acetyl-CoA C-acetyltransferase [Burkholderia stagnalis]RQQ87498.1 acetyl-CoA C-acetyltransferase [Burkholderia stagnalis]RQQ94600.1 acetyl-CoA C-acetyltransferase [Burkholderia stagnalis]
MANSYIVGAARTPRGKGKIGKGALTGVHPQELLASVLRELPKRSDFDVRDVDDAVVGAVSQIGAQGANIARNSVLAAGWPQEIGGVSLNRFCGSGLQAVNFAAMGVASGAQQLVVAGGVESMSQFGLGADGGGQDAGNIKLRERVFQVPQGISADLIATLEGFSREDVDAWALRSQENAAVAINEGRFNRSLVPVSDPFTGELLLTRDEFPRPDTTAQGLAALRPSFEALGRQAAGPNGETLDQIAVAAYPQAGTIRHIHTAGNSSGIVDGAAAVAIASEDYVKAHGLKPLARIRAVATVGSEPLIMLTAPALASRKALRMAGMHPNDIDLWEINEAFAAVVLQAIRQLEIDPARVNVNGGSIALGHPLGATGAILIGTALDELERRGKSTALISMCIGGGQGIATLIERV